MSLGELIANVEMASSTLRAWTVKDVERNTEGALDALHTCADRFADVAEKLRALEAEAGR